MYIDVYDIAGGQVVDEHIADTIFEIISKSVEKTIWLDFYGVDFVSESFIKRYLDLKLDMLGEKQVLEVNLHSGVEDQFDNIKG